jgi:hypothetical protein
MTASMPFWISGLASVRCLFEVFIDFGEGRATTDDNAFAHRGFGRVKGIFDTEFLVFHLALGEGADFEDGDAIGELGDAFGKPSCRIRS